MKKLIVVLNLLIFISYVYSIDNSDFKFNESKYYLNQDNEYLYYIFPTFFKVKIFRFKLNNFIIEKKDESIIYKKSNNLYTNFDNERSLIFITDETLKIGENLAYRFSYHFKENYDQKKYGNNLIIAKYIYNKIINKQFNNYSEEINEEYYKKSFVIITIFGTFLLSSNNPNFTLTSSKNFFEIPNGSQVENISIKDYFWGDLNINRGINLPKILKLKFDKYNAIDILATGRYSFEIEYLRIY